MKNILSSPKIIVERLLMILIILAILYFIIACTAAVMTQPFSFDGAINAQVSKELVKNLRYATTYNRINYFDPRIQTGLPVLLPVAILFGLFGISFENGLIVNALYLVLLLLTVLFYLKYCLKISNGFILLFIFFFGGIPELFTYGFGLYGEIPTLFYFLLSVISLYFHHKNKKSIFLFYSGLSIGLGYLTKTVILISLPAFIFVAIFDYFFSNRYRILVYLKNSLWVCFGFCIPILIFETYKLVSLGFSQYLKWWNDQINVILMQAGVKSGFSDTNGLVAKFLNHYDQLAFFLQINKYLLGFLLLILLFLFLAILIYRAKNFLSDKKTTSLKEIIINNDFLVLIIVTLSYFAWWLLITSTQKAWYRRIINGVVLFDICLTIFIFVAYQFVKERIDKSSCIRKIPFTNLLPGLFVVIIFASSVISFLKTGNGRVTFEDSASKLASIQAGLFISTLPSNADMYGYDWWQAPIISFTSDRTFYDLNVETKFTENENSNEKYLVIDSYAYNISDFYYSVLEKYEHQLLFSADNNYIYQLVRRAAPPYLSFSDQEKQQVKLNYYDFRKTVISTDGYIVKNVYLDEKMESGKWAERESAYLLNYKNENLLQVFVIIPSVDKYLSSTGTKKIDVYINHNFIFQYEIIGSGLQEITIPFTIDDPQNYLEVELSSNFNVISEQDTRDLSFIIQAIGTLQNKE